MTCHQRSALYVAGIMEDYFLLIFNTHILFSRAINVQQLTFFEIAVSKCNVRNGENNKAKQSNKKY